jgi:hypothetical protein
MVGWLVGNESEKMWKEVVIFQSEIIPHKTSATINPHPQLKTHATFSKFIMINNKKFSDGVKKTVQ